MESSFKFYDQMIDSTIEFRKVDYDRDLNLLHKWMNEDHVIPFWQLDDSLDKFSDHLQQALSDEHQTLYIGNIDGEAMSYWEAYWVKGDVVEKCYEPEPYDQGIHLLIGEPAFLGKGYALPLLESMLALQFEVEETTKVIAEPDIRNKKMIHVFEQCGFEPVKSIELPDKTGLLMFCHREAFERRRQDARQRNIESHI